jgi:hypothetical protein
MVRTQGNAIVAGLQETAEILLDGLDVEIG